MGQESHRPSGEPTTKQVVLQFLYLGVSLLGSGLLMKWATSQLDPTRHSKKKAQIQKRALGRRLGRMIETDSHEDVIACDVINPGTIDVTMADVGGHEGTKAVLNNKVIYPLKYPTFYNSYLLRQAKGVLLYGPPGTGKTLLAKALAKEAGAIFINIRASTLQNKWFGETQKLVQAVFTLAYKLQPCIVFIDEVDALLGRRREQEHDAVTTMKTEFMQLWDGFNTDPNANVMILAATNRPYELDDAVLRRFSVQLEVGMPDAAQREAILGIILRRHTAGNEGGPGIASDLVQNRAGPDGRRPQAKIAEQTDGFNGSDLLELCSRAASLTIQDRVARLEAAIHEDARAAGEHRHLAQFMSGRQPHPRDITLTDFLTVLRTFQPSNYLADAYRARMSGSRRSQVPSSELPEMQATNLPLLWGTLYMLSRLSDPNAGSEPAVY